MHDLRRPAALAAAMIVALALVACSSATTDPAADPAQTAAPPAVASTAADPIVAFVDQFGHSTDTVWLTGSEVEDEFHAASAEFPLELPEGYVWPTDLSRPLGTVSEYQRGTGAAEAYLYWASATATAAFADHFHGDAASATAHLDDLVDGYASPVRSMYFDTEHPGTDSDYYRAVLEPAVAGDFDPLTHALVASFLTNDEYRAIARQAGDVIPVGTEGFSRSIEDRPGDPGYIEPTRVELEQRIADRE